MRKIFPLLILISLINTRPVFSQDKQKDTLSIIQMDEITIHANRVPVNLERNPGSISWIGSSQLTTLPKGIGADEALRLVPGVRIDNQANGSRVHMSILGQGILSEHGLRGIKVLLDGIPLNDPSGFAPDLYDVDWSLVKNIEVLRGSAASMYGGAANAGVLDITTLDGRQKPFNSFVSGTTGSNGFYKILGQVDGTEGNWNYRLSASGTGGNGYRQHSAFRGSDISEKINWNPSRKLSFTQVFMSTYYFNQNAEGLSLGQLNDPKQANPDAIPYNEFQQTNRITNGLTAHLGIAPNQEFVVSGFIRWTGYEEPGSSVVDHRHQISPGGSFQYNLKLGKNIIQNQFAAGIDYQAQSIDEYKLENIRDSLRTEKIGGIDKTVNEGDLLMANQLIRQKTTGIFLIDQVELYHAWNAILSIRYDNILNGLTDHLNGPVNLSGNADFKNVTARVGISYVLATDLNVYGDWSTGFIPPATEELSGNPAAFGGFNAGLVPATSKGGELGFKGNIGRTFQFDIAGFLLNTLHDFYRYRILPQRPLETFYGNAGGSRRKGIELYAAYSPVRDFNISLAYTYSDFKYLTTSRDSNYVGDELLPAVIKGYTLPDSPASQLNSEIEYRLSSHFTLGAGNDYQSSWYIYPNAKVLQQGFLLFNARASCSWKIGGYNLEFSIYGKNLSNEKYMAFTEPDPDGNCYQAGPRREFFIQLRAGF